MHPSSFSRCELSAAEIQRLIAEDAPYGDLTTQSMPIGESAGTLSFAARADMTLAASEEAAAMLQACGAHVHELLASGSTLPAGQIFLRASGPAGALLLGWKSAQTLVEACSGIATATARLVEALRAEGYDIPVACTRKSFPGTRRMAAKAVRAGGGIMHRLGLSESLLVFPEHRAFVPDDGLQAVIAAIRCAQPEKKLVVEVGSAEEALRLARAGADVLQLERMAPDALRALRQSLAEAGLDVRVAPAGGVTLANALDYARAGADFLVTSSPYFAPPADVKVVIGPPSGPHS